MKRYLHLLLRSIVISTVLVELAACGGGGTKGDGSTSPITDTPVLPATGSMVVAVDVDRSLSVDIRNSIKNVASSIERRPLGARLTAPDNSSAAVLGLNDAGDLMLASEMDLSGKVTLSINSTALVVVKLMLDRSLIAAMGLNANEIIQRSAAFAGLLQAIDGALVKSQPIVESPAVVTAVAAVVQEILASTPTATGISRANVVRPFATTVAAASSPVATNPSLNIDNQDANASTEEDAMILIGGKISETFSGVRVEGLSSGFLRISNTTLLTWAVITEDTAGTPGPVLQSAGQPAMSSDGRRVILPPSKPSSINAAIGYKLGLPSSSIDLGYGPTPSLGGNLVIEQTDETRRENAIAVFSNMIDVLSIAIPNSCVKEIAKGIVSNQDFAGSIASGQFRLAVKQLGILSVSDWVSIFNSASSINLSCFVGMSKAELAGYLVPQVRVFVKVFELLSSAGASILGANQAAITLNQMEQFGSRSALRFGICVSKVTQKLINCVHSIRVLPYQSPQEPANTLPSLVVGATLPMRIETLDDKGKPTPFSASLRWWVDGVPQLTESTSVSPAPLFVVCTISSSCSYQVTGGIGYTGDALKSNPFLFGISKIEVIDYATGVSGAMFFRSVASGNLTSPKATIGIGEEVEIRLLDPEGYAIFGNDQVVWESSDTRSVSLIKAQGNEFNPIIAKARGLSPTSNTPVQIVVRNSDGSLLGSTSLSVDGSFAFETTESAIPLATRMNCAQIFGFQDQNLTHTFHADQCFSNLDAAIRCVGDGCGTDRFMVAISGSVQTYAYNSVTDNPNQPCSPLSSPFLPSGDFTSVYTPGSNWWSGLGSAWNKASPTSFPITIFDKFVSGGLYRNFVGLDSTLDTGNLAGRCWASSGTLDVEYNIFDKLKGTYTKIPFRLTLP